MGISDATRLVRTELNYVQNQSALDGIREAGLEYYQFCATLDGRTSQRCRELDGDIFPVKDAKPGENMPPLHPRCRSTVFGCLGDDKQGKGQRIARDSEGRNIRIPAGMEYYDWKAVYIDKKLTQQDWSDMSLNLKPPSDEFIKLLANKVKLPYTLGKKGEERFYADNGQPIYPMNDGAVGEPVSVTLEPGVELLDRYGANTGRFVSPKGTSFEERALPNSTDVDDYHIFRVKNPISNAQKAVIAPWFGQEGGGIQYKLPERIKQLLGQYLEEVL